MGLLTAIADCLHCAFAGRSALAVFSAAGLALIVVSVVVNVLIQFLFKNPNEPPVVFHWFPYVGSTLDYGMNPFAFFDKCKKRVSHLHTSVMVWVLSL